MCIICITYDLDRITIKEARAAIKEAKLSGLADEEHLVELEIRLLDAEFQQAIRSLRA